MNDLFLSGTTPTGQLHLGNYLGSMKTLLDLQSSTEAEIFILIADWHSLIKLKDAHLRKHYIYDLAAAWLALGLDINRAVLYRQSDVSSLQELNWILTTLTNKGLLERAHAYKALRKEEQQTLEMGLFSYPILMAADILSIQATHVVVGKDQLQHIEVTRELSSKIASMYHVPCVQPTAVLDKNFELVRGTDGRKMSKSYGNTIPLFIDREGLHQAILNIVTMSATKDEPKDYKNCNIFHLYQAFANEMQVADMRNQYEEGISFKEAKEQLFELLDNFFHPFRIKYNYLLSNIDIVEKYLIEGAEKAKIKADSYVSMLKSALGL